MKKNQKKLSYLGVLVLWMIFSFCVSGFAYDITSLKVQFLKGEYRQAIIEGEKILGKENTKELSPELYYILGLCYLKDGNLLRAADIFEIVLNELSGSDFKVEARLGLADTYLLRGDLTKAESLYKSLLADQAAEKFKPHVYYRLSQVALKNNALTEAQNYLDVLHKEYPFNAESFTQKDICPLPDADEKIFYSVQVGVFQNGENAKKLTSELKGKGFDAYLEETSLLQSASYRVRVGKFVSRTQAVEEAKKLADSGYPTKVCP